MNKKIKNVWVVLLIYLFILVINMFVKYDKDKKNKFGDYNPVYSFIAADELYTYLNGYLITHEDDLEGIMTIEGKVLIEPSYSGIYDINEFYDKLIVSVYEDDKSYSVVYDNETGESTVNDYLINVVIGNNDDDKYISYTDDGKNYLIDGDSNIIVTNTGSDEFGYVILGDYVLSIDYVNNKKNRNTLWNINGEKLANFTDYYEYNEYILLTGDKTLVINLNEDTITEYDDYSINEMFAVLSIGDDKYYLNYDMFVKGNDGNIPYKSVIIGACNKGKYNLKDELGNDIISTCVDSFILDHLEQGVVGYHLKDKNSVYNINNKKLVEGEYYYFNGDYIYFDDTAYDYDLNKIEKESLFTECEYPIEYAKYNVCLSNIWSELIGPDKESYGKYQSVSCNNDGLCVLFQNGKYALFNNGKIIVDFGKYKEIIVDDDIAILKNYNKSEYIRFNYAKKNQVVKISKITLPLENIDLDEYIAENDLRSIKDVIYNNKELFVQYASIVDNNSNLGSYKHQVLMMFKMFSQYQSYIDLVSFYNGLLSLKIEWDLTTADRGAAGEYYDYDNKILLSDDSDGVIYHELTHFMDYRSSFDSHDLYICDDKYYDYDEAFNGDFKLCERDYDLSGYNRILIEGGAEYLSVKDINNYRFRAYSHFTQLYFLFQYMFGENKLNEMFFHNDDNYQLYKLLTERGGLTTEEYKEFYKILNDTGFSFDANNNKIFHYLEKIFTNVMNMDPHGNIYSNYILSNYYVKTENGIDPYELKEEAKNSLRYLLPDPDMYIYEVNFMMDNDTIYILFDTIDELYCYNVNNQEITVIP